MMWPLFQHISRRTFIKDVHKVIGYSSPFSEEETKIILSRINDSESPEELNRYLSKPRANILFQEVHQSGHIKKIESLLDLKKFDTKVIESMSRKILKFNPSDARKKVYGSKPLKDSSSYGKYIYPLFSDAHEATSFVTFRVFPDSIAFVHFDRTNRQVTDMKSTPLKLHGFERSFQFEFHDAYDQIRAVIQEIPSASFFVQEKSAPISSRDSSIPFRVALHSLNIIFTTLLYEIRYGSETNGAFLSPFHKSEFIYNARPTLVNSLFDLKIGTERISGSSRIQHILRQDPNSPFFLDIHEDLWTRDFYQRSSIHQEKLAQLLFLTSAFNFVHQIN